MLEITAQGAAFVAAARAAWDCAPLRALAEEERVAYPTAVAAAGHGLPLDASLQASSSHRSPRRPRPRCASRRLGRPTAKKSEAHVIPRIRALAREAANSTLADLGSCAFLARIASMRQATQNSGLFRSLADCVGLPPQGRFLAAANSRLAAASTREYRRATSYLGVDCRISTWPDSLINASSIMKRNELRI